MPSTVDRIPKTIATPIIFVFNFDPTIKKNTLEGTLEGLRCREEWLDFCCLCPAALGTLTRAHFAGLVPTGRRIRLTSLPCQTLLSPFPTVVQEPGSKGYIFSFLSHILLLYSIQTTYWSLPPSVRCARLCECAAIAQPSICIIHHTHTYHVQLLILYLLLLLLQLSSISALWLCRRCYHCTWFQMFAIHSRRFPRVGWFGCQRFCFKRDQQRVLTSSVWACARVRVCVSVTAYLSMIACVRQN